MVPERFDHQFRRSYPGHASFAAEARRALCAFAVDCGLTSEDVDDVRIAIGEILALAVQRTTRPATDGAFLLAARCFGDRLEVEVQSQTARFATRTAVRDPALDSLAPRGLGMQILRKVVTQVAFSDGGTRVRFVKRRSP